MELFHHIAENIPEYNTLVKSIKKFPVENKLPTLLTGVSHIQKAHFLASLMSETLMFPLLVLTDTEGEATRLMSDINIIAGGNQAVVYPSREYSFVEMAAVSREYEHKRLAVLNDIINHKCKIVLACPEAAAQYTMPIRLMTMLTFTLKSGDVLQHEPLLERLVSCGMSRTSMVEGVSQFSMRGDILDIFPINSEFPIRIEFWGDEIDTVSYFDIDTQRRIDTIPEIQISPAREVITSDTYSLSEKIGALIVKNDNFGKGKRTEKAIQTLLKATRMLRRDVEQIEGGVAPNSDKYLPLIYEDMLTTLFDYCGSVVVCERSNVLAAYQSTYAGHMEDITALLECGDLCPPLDGYMLPNTTFETLLEQHTAAIFDNFMHGGGQKLCEVLSLETISLSPWNGEHAALLEDITDYMEKNYSGVIFAGTEKAAQTLAEDLREDGFKATYMEEPKKLFAKTLYVVGGTLTGGFLYQSARFFAITSAGISDSKQRIAPKRKKDAISSLDDIHVGDLVVHNTYGIGIFEGVEKLTADKISKDYIKVKYGGKDVLYVPVTQLDLISRYIGGGDADSVRLHKLSSDSWKKAKKAAKTAAKEMATELIALYKKRLQSKGYAYGADAPEQKDFENHFAYVETDDQLRCVDEIKGDMERESPMDRLLCGDVGFGKTEVALRGAFKCIMEGKQCALLCPTTVLAWQHYQTVTKRMEGFPINVELLSRFRNPKEQKEVIRKLNSGIVDIVIGTHRLVQDDVKFKDLGLVIIDEEQRFGVAHKEHFKETFPDVDILTLSATPIPRTLNMALSGIRDMSLIETPPLLRQPITTYVCEHDVGIIIGAINKELRRNGQVYYIHNRIETIASCAAKLHEMIPEAAIGIAYGKMEEDELLEVWRKLLEHEIDILVCTTLIETGVDVPNVNTLIIENADYMGLAQLHQLRGRVGRTNRRAFAYFTFKRGKVLSEIATKRLTAIKEFTRFGSGFKIAMKDLEIRGSGSILGASQSGHLMAVGYDMYIKLLNEAVAEERGEKIEVKTECVIDIKINAFIPETYIGTPGERIVCYKKIANIENADDAYDVTDELIDRYGEIPEPVAGLIDVAVIRHKAGRLGISEISEDGDSIVVIIDKPNMEKLSILCEQLNAGVEEKPKAKAITNNGGVLTHTYTQKKPVQPRVTLDFTEKPCIRVKLLEDKPLQVVKAVVDAL